MSQIIIPSQESGERIDALLAHSGFTRSAAARLIGEGRVLRDGRAVKKSDLTRVGDVFTVEVEDEPVPTEAQPARSSAERSSKNHRFIGKGSLPYSRVW